MTINATSHHVLAPQANCLDLDGGARCQISEAPLPEVMQPEAIERLKSTLLNTFWLQPIVSAQVLSTPPP